MSLKMKECWRRNRSITTVNICPVLRHGCAKGDRFYSTWTYHHGCCPRVSYVRYSVWWLVRFKRAFRHGCSPCSRHEHDAASRECKGCTALFKRSSYPRLDALSMRCWMHGCRSYSWMVMNGDASVSAGTGGSFSAGTLTTFPVRELLESTSYYRERRNLCPATGNWLRTPRLLGIGEDDLGCVASW